MSLTPVANLLPLLLIPVANFPPKSTTLAKLVAKIATGVVYTGNKFATGVVDLQISLQILEEILIDPNGILWGRCL